MANVLLDYSDITDIFKEKLKVDNIVKKISSIFLNPRYADKVNYKPYFQRNYVWDSEKAWLFENGFDVNFPNPTNKFVSQYYGTKPLWKTAYSQGVVVMEEHNSDYFIVMECSNMNKGYKNTKIILTLGGCI